MNIRVSLISAQTIKPPKLVFTYRSLETKHRNPSLHIHTKTNPHKVSNITQRYLQKCSYRRAGVDCTVREHLVFCCLSLYSPVWGECLLVGEMGREMSGSAQGSLFCRVRAPEPFHDWTLSSGVNRRASRNAAALSVLKELETPERKANVSVGRPRWLLWDIFLALLCSIWQI